jgi:hypothetical protein
MNSFIKIILALIGLYLIGVLAIAVFKLALELIIPVLVLGAIGYIILSLIGGRLGGNNDKSLPR